MRLCLYAAASSAHLHSCVTLPPQVGLKHPLEDEDVVQIVLKVRCRRNCRTCKEPADRWQL